MRYVTIAMLSAHTGRSEKAVRSAIRFAGIKLERIPRVHGFRIPEMQANRFLLKHWPGTPLLPEDLSTLVQRDSDD